MKLFTTPLGSILTLAGIFVGGVIGLVLISTVLAVAGGPDSCTPGGGPITLSTANADSFQAKWDGFNSILDSGSPSSITFNESEVSSRTDQYIREETSVNIDDLRICFHDGSGEASGKLKAVGVGAHVLMSGSVDFSANPATAEINNIEVGSVPGFLIDLAELAGADANDALNEVLDSLILDHSYTVIFSEGEIQVNGQP